MKNKIKGFTPILIPLLIIAAVVVFGGYLLLRQNNTQKQVTSNPMPVQYQNQYKDGASKVQPIQNSSDLLKTSADLDASLNSQLDTHLSQLNSISF